MNMTRGMILPITTLPIGIHGLEISLNSTVDIDIRLFDASGLCLFGYRCMYDNEVGITHNVI